MKKPGKIKARFYFSPGQAFEPHLFRYMPEGRDVRGGFVVNIDESALPAIIPEIRKRYDEFFPGNPFEYFFLDEYYDRQYQRDQRLGNVFGVFSLLAMIVTSLGILGLSSFMAAQRTKEIGLRKILGAGVARINILLTKDFLRLIVLAFLLALPIVTRGIHF